MYSLYLLAQASVTISLHMEVSTPVSSFEYNSLMLLSGGTTERSVGILESSYRQKKLEGGAHSSIAKIGPSISKLRMFMFSNFTVSQENFVNLDGSQCVTVRSVQIRFTIRGRSTSRHLLSIASRASSMTMYSVALSSDWIMREHGKFYFLFVILMEPNFKMRFLCRLGR